MSRPSYEDTRDNGAANGPSYPPTAPPVRPPARWAGIGGHPLPRVDNPEPGYAASGYGAEVSGAEVSGYGTPTGAAGPEAARYGAPAATSPLSAPTAPGFGTRATTGYAGAETGGFPARAATGYAGADTGGYPARAATGYAGADTGAYPAREVPRYGAPEAPPFPASVAPAYHASEAPARPVAEHAGRGPQEAPRYGGPEGSGYAEASARPAPTASGAPEVGGHSAPAGGEPVADGYSGQAVQNQIRQAVVHRVQYANALHASHFWDLRRTKPVGPHALVFMYASLDPRFSDPRRPYYEIKAASRLFRDGADVQDLPVLLHELTEIAKGYLADGRVFDPVAQMTQSAEPIPADATYVGIAVSTLLGSGEEFGNEPAGVIGGMGIPGRALVVLSDNNLLVVERPARAHEQVEVYSTFPYTTGGGVEYRSWRSFSQEQQADPAWHWLQHLNQLVLAGQERKAAGTAAGGSGGRRRR
ncbi:hypothetical protein ACL02O_29885 [Micromonospora sp. MS34]|uniref:hypothetical protein n=1 Tax=Micromonospora sp. MS34 TaxID=3385971 RepID=UPI0039A00CE4